MNIKTIFLTACLMAWSSVSIAEWKEGESIYDASGKIELKIFYDDSIVSTAHSGHFSFDVRVADGYVAVGGGAASNRSPHTSQHLVSSYPAHDFPNRDNRYLQSWKVEMKDQKYPDNTPIHGYAIGMKIEGLSASYLKQLMVVGRSYGINSGHVSTSSAQIPANHVMIGGGSEVKWHPGQNGHLLMSNFPSTLQTWNASSKDHNGFSQITYVSAHPLSLPRIIPGVGEIVSRIFASRVITGSKDSATALSTDGFALSTCGTSSNYGVGHSGYYGPGRFVTRIQPQMTIGNYGGCILEQTDNEYGDNTTRMQAWALGVKIIN